MTNPTPRPALRKADDAGIHPAAPKPARTPRTRTAAAASATAADEAAPARTAKAPAKAPVKAPARSAAKPVAVADVAEAEAPAAPAKPRTKHRGAGPAKPTDRPKGKRAFQGTTSDHLRRTDAPATPHDELHDAKPKKRAKADDLMSGGTTTLKVTVPKKLRKAAAKEAKRRGLDVDAVVADLLHAWLTGRR
ncbi:MAG: hypothetical protein LCI03_12955 [Actinobacteria bacterium]|nr:hypothetical protein [Actinomycetota bacterium]